METKITTSSVRVALSHNYSTFEVTLNLENPEGITIDEISSARSQAQELATEAVNEYKRTPNVNAKEEVKRIENKLNDLKKFIEKDEPAATDPEEIKRVENLPMFDPEEFKAQKEEAVKPAKKSKK